VGGGGRFSMISVRSSVAQMSLKIEEERKGEELLINETFDEHEIKEESPSNIFNNTRIIVPQQLDYDRLFNIIISFIMHRPDIGYLPVIRL
jgi:hypothetical protein